MVGARVTRIIDSNWSASRGSTARMRASAAVTSSTRSPVSASSDATPAGYASNGGWRPSSRPSTSTIRSSALSPMPGMDACPARPSVARAEAEHALLTYTERVHAPSVEVEHLPRTLVHDHVAPHLFGNVVAQPLRAVGRARLLVARDDDQQLAALRPPSRAPETARRGDLARDLSLHVEGAASPHEAVLDLPGPRVDAPLGRIREHGVDVAQITEPLSLGLAAQPRDQVGPLLRRAHQLALEARRLELGAQHLLRRPLVARAGSRC